MCAAPTNAETLVGVLERIIFFNEENHYTIAELRPEALRGGPAHTRDERDGEEPKVTIVGALPGVECGETLHLRGEWTHHTQHGPQFRIAEFKSELPASVYGIRKYLGSGLVPGIGKVYATKIVDAFGADTFRVLSEDSGRLRRVPGIGKKRATSIKQAWDEKRAERELYIFLQTYGVTPARCVKLVNRFGAEAKQILSENPYRVAREIDGIGFKTADQIAINLGFANDAPPRLDAGLLYALETLQEDGHSAYPRSELAAHSAALLNTERDLVEARIDALIAARAIVAHDAPPRATNAQGQILQLPLNHRAESRIAAAISRLLQTPSGLPSIKIDAAVDWAAQKAGFTFHPLQASALRAALAHKVSILTGGPGTGKTTILRALVDILRAKKTRVHLAAPTGRAAQRLAETTGGYASTIHRLLKFEPAKGRFAANENSPLATDFLIVDEASMLDVRLAAALLAAVPNRAHLLLVGDTDQLPSVGAGDVLNDLIAVAQTTGDAPTAAAAAAAAAATAATTATTFPVTRLSAIYRQKGQSGIVTTAHAINAGDPATPPLHQDFDTLQAWADLSFIAATDAQDCVAKILDLCSQHIPRLLRWPHPIRDLQVLAPMHKGAAGVANLNAQLQAALNPQPQGIRWSGIEFRAGDKIIQLRNNYDLNLFNGDIGTITAIDGREGTLSADFDGETHTLTRRDFGDLAHAYCISIHKSQGSEYPIVIIPLLKAHFMMLQRNLLYTAITRGKKKVFLVGDPTAYAMAVRNAESKQRCTHLRPALHTELGR
ncbi:recombinase RecD [Cephaloticoccus primus]|uniref:Recombinase RecD n=1 Tax=Cephaloticoccus primus TaxID=1548207 RepID=A0A139SLI1_9BACT|nr:ATP-dependent RecD-like DNA helicase [Cephaloticoccus primus]KXU35344.1 recombinase RecD [Cephaloticoccus primus]